MAASAGLPLFSVRMLCSSPGLIKYRHSERMQNGSILISRRKSPPEKQMISISSCQWCLTSIPFAEGTVLYAANGKDLVPWERFSFKVDNCGSFMWKSPFGKPGYVDIDVKNVSLTGGTVNRAMRCAARCF